MKTSLGLTVAGVVLTTVMGSGAIAQTTPETLESQDIPTGTAADLQISPRIGIGHTSSGSGYDGTTRFEGFVPLRQIPGADITFLESRFLLDNDGDIGGNIILGHREYDEPDDRIWGGYVAFDSRETDDNTFHQLGLGVETLGEIWDARINGYIPLGDSSQLVDEDIFDTGVQNNARFEENLLLLSQRREQRITRIREVALGGFDAEVGARIAHWDGGDLRGYGGIYFYGGEGVSDSLGWRLRLDANPTDTIDLGLAVQHDDIFGTNVIASVGITFPGTRPVGPITDAEIVQARLGEPVVRNYSIAIDTQTETDVIVDEEIEPLINPEEEGAYQFQHVVLGREGGDGTFENPFGTVEEALDATISDGNAVVYVDQGNAEEIPAFTIPERVRVLSQGPRQFLAGLPFADFPITSSRLPFSPVTNFDDGILVELPFSGDGNFPVIQDGNAATLVRMRDRTILSGFLLEDAPQTAIVANDAVDIEIRENTITNSGERGIFLSDVSGSLVMFDNEITNSRGDNNSGQGIFILNQSEEAIDVTIDNHLLDNNRIGLEFQASGDRNRFVSPSQIINVTDTEIINSRDQGIFIQADNLGNQRVSFENGDVLDSGAEGLLVQSLSGGSQEVSFADSILSGSGSSGIVVQAGELDGTFTAAQEIFIRNSVIEDNDGIGIDIEGNESVAQELTIRDNIIRNNEGDGIRAIVNNNGFLEFVTDEDNESLGISGNTITGNAGQGINIEANDASTVVADIQDNTLRRNQTRGLPDLEITTTSTTNNACVVVVNNTTAGGIQLDNNSTGLPSFFEVGDLGNLSVSNVGGVTLLPDESVFTNLPDVTSCF